MNAVSPAHLSAGASSAVLRFMLAALLAAAIIILGAYWVVGRNAVAEATRNAQEVAAIDGRGIVGPALTDAVINGDPAATAAFDAIIRDRVLSSRVVRTKIWTLGGEILYSDARDLVGRTFPLTEEQRRATRESRIVAQVSQLSNPDNRFEHGFGPLLEVYLPIHSASGRTFLFETYQVFSSIEDDKRRIWSAFFPVLAGGIGLLLVVQLPLAWRLAKSLDSARRESEALHIRALEASETERRRIARDLHDGVVQTLAGASFHLGAAAGQVAGTSDEKLEAVLQDGAAATRQAVRDLRTLIVEIAPPDLEGSRLEGALVELLAPLEGQGIGTSLKAGGLEPVDRKAAAVLYRAAQEAIRNASAHAGATQVDVTASAASGAATLEVRDNGRGFTADEVLERQRDGHVGLALLRSLVEDAGGVLSVSSQPGKGSAIDVTVPAT
jgi:signal transduction histidine kinase